MTDPYISREQQRFSKELELFRQYPPEELASIIRDVGFHCNRCGGCCKSGQNGHVFLLDKDADKAINLCPDALIPAPLFEICDRNGDFYVSGYALRTHQDGSCIHLSDTTCKMYQDRFSICHVYPYMLHREPDEKGKMTFRQISGLNEHGEYHNPITEELSKELAREAMEYEEAWLMQMIHFFEDLSVLFNASGQRSVRKIYDKRMKDFREGKPVRVFVYHNRQFNPVIVTNQDYSGILE